MGGQNVRTELKGEQQLLYADMDGAVRIARGVLAIKPVVHFKGDTNHNVGTVEQDKDVFISGSVGPNFAINAGGSVTIDGMVESGATIHAQEDIVVAKGIVGHQTRVVALGSVEAQFVQGGSVVARGDVIIGSHLLNARVRAGGQVVASQGIAAGEVRGTSLSIGPDPDIVAQMRQLDEAIEFCKTNVMRIFRTLGLKDIDVSHLKKLIEGRSPDKRAPMIRILEQLKSLAATRVESTKKRQELEIKLKHLIAEASIEISGAVSAGVVLRMGDKTLTVPEDLPGAAFQKVAEGISWSKRG